MRGETTSFTSLDSPCTPLPPLPPHSISHPRHTRLSPHALLLPRATRHAWPCPLCQKMACRPFARSGARYSALPHCSRPLPTASGHLGPPQRVSRGRLGVWDTASCRPLLNLSPLSSMELARLRRRPRPRCTTAPLFRGPPELSYGFFPLSLFPSNLPDKTPLPLAPSCPSMAAMVAVGPHPAPGNQGLPSSPLTTRGSAAGHGILPAPSPPALVLTASRPSTPDAARHRQGRRRPRSSQAA